jgi:hypothetical protein
VLALFVRGCPDNTSLCHRPSPQSSPESGPSPSPSPERVCCLLVLDSVTSTPRWIRQPEAAWWSLHLPWVPVLHVLHVLHACDSTPHVHPIHAPHAQVLLLILREVLHQVPQHLLRLLHLLLLISEQMLVHGRLRVLSVL